MLAAKCALGVRVDALGDVNDEGAVGLEARAKVGAAQRGAARRGAAGRGAVCCSLQQPWAGGSTCLWDACAAGCSCC